MAIRLSSSVMSCAPCGELADAVSVYRESREHILDSIDTHAWLKCAGASDSGRPDAANPVSTSSGRAEARNSSVFGSGPIDAALHQTLQQRWRPAIAAGDSSGNDTFIHCTKTPSSVRCSRAWRSELERVEVRRPRSPGGGTAATRSRRTFAR